MTYSVKNVVAPFLGILLLATHLVQAQPVKVYRVGVIFEGGPYYVAIDGLKSGLKDLGWTEGKNYVLETQDLKGDRTAAEEVAKSFERDRVDLIYALSTTVSTAVKRATTQVPIVFAVGSDPVSAGLVESFARPGGRLTGVHYQASVDVLTKRLEILKALVPGLHRVVTFYDPGNPTAVAAAKSAKEAARQFDIELLERRVASVGELRVGLNALKTQDADAYFYTNDAMISSQAQLIIDAARIKKLPTMFTQTDFATQGALASYGVSWHEIGRQSAKYVQRVLTGTSPQDLPVESLSRVALVVNLKTAREIGVTIPQAVRLRADQVIE
jgi:putative tryptophan/tyrosine transport system substrate-binding protein